ncbi:hypothetical protein [Actinoplanes couchii]|uniref:Uncharacterized protein n=1 Tax=Actinoplanes couchii TaxID=403638 RepID=A0ABQ3XDN5_9ACTN|nr:hypothetical protein [Actinoplanes couchii]MDR6317122.1 hypothetical protein [Actinoplanes couchii]GID56616.1 hypothetical protein Aco03nite_050200 [Actinoplanes couchii]
MDVISLTGPDSHRLTRAPGVGSCSLGGPEADLRVAPGDRIDWTVFDRFSTPAGSPWPRWIAYRGDDTSWIEWSRRRPIEGFTWAPTAGHDVDTSNTDIHTLGVRLGAAPVRLVLPPSRHFSVSGDLTRFTPVLAPGAECPSLGFAPDGAECALPVMPALAGATDVAVSVQPLRQVFDCASLLPFTGLRSLQLSGGLTNLEALAGLRGLTALQLRFVPDMAGLPPLTGWPDLEHLIAWNVDDREGRRLRTEFREVSKGWPGYSSVSKLRSPEWFATEYRLPFAAWPPKSARAATRAFRAAEKAIAEAGTEPEVEAAIHRFVTALNRLPAMETTEREDAGEAVMLLTTETPMGDLTDQAGSWFETTRDF